MCKACTAVWGKNVSVARNRWRTGPLMRHPGAAIVSAKTQRLGRAYGGFDSSQSKMLRFPGIDSHNDAVIKRAVRVNSERPVLWMLRRSFWTNAKEPQNRAYRTLFLDAANS